MWIVHDHVQHLCTLNAKGGLAGLVLFPRRSGGGEKKENAHREKTRSRDWSAVWVGVLCGFDGGIRGLMSDGLRRS